jgi:putative ABC transport system substrate-binding protein
VITRRTFLRTLSAWGLIGAGSAIGQSAQIRVAWLSGGRETDGALFLEALRGGFQELGHSEGRNFSIEQYWGEGSGARMQKLAAEVVASKPHAVVTQGPGVLALRPLTNSLPVVFGFSGDPVEAGLVESLARPGRNFTGITFLTLELVGKRVELLKEALPRMRRLAVVANPQHPGDQAERRASQAAATALGLTLEYFEARNPAQLDEALAAIEKARSDAAMLFPVQYVINNRERIAAWSIKNRIPTISGWSQFAEGGNLMT